MYNYTPSPWKTQLAVRKILSEEYSNGPGGLGGNDDAGQMSAWYVFAAMGFYPVNPVSGQYLLCSPIFERATINLPGNKKFEIVCHKTSANAVYINAVKLNGQSIAKDFISYNQVMKGGKLDLYMQEKPNKDWANKSQNQPK